MKSRLHWILAAITVIIAYLFQSATGKRLLFFDKVPDNIHELIFDNSLIIVGCLAFIYILVYLIIWCSSKNKQKKICDNVCEHIFKFIKEKTNDNFMQFIRVTIFKAKYIKFDWAKLVFHSRHQTRIPYKKTKLKFKPGYGCAGMCFQTQTLILQKIQEFNPNQPEIYEKESKKILNFDKKNIKKLNMKSCTFLGIPLKCFNSDIAWGVLLIDSIKWHEKFESIAREIENITENYSVFF